MRCDVGQRLAVGRNGVGLAPQKAQQRPINQNKGPRRNMRDELGVGQGTVGKRECFINSAEHPKRDGINNFRDGPGILAETIGKITMPRRIVEREDLPNMLVGGGKVAEIPAVVAGHAVRDHGLGAIRPGSGLAQEKLRRVAHRRRFAARAVPRPKTEIGGEAFRQSLRPGSPIRGRAQRPRWFRAPDALWPRSARCRGWSANAAGCCSGRRSAASRPRPCRSSRSPCRDARSPP